MFTANQQEKRVSTLITNQMAGYQAKKDKKRKTGGIETKLRTFRKALSRPVRVRVSKSIDAPKTTEKPNEGAKEVPPKQTDGAPKTTTEELGEGGDGSLRRSQRTVQKPDRLEPDMPSAAPSRKPPGKGSGKGSGGDKSSKPSSSKRTKKPSEKGGKGNRVKTPIERKSGMPPKSESKRSFDDEQPAASPELLELMEKVGNKDNWEDFKVARPPWVAYNAVSPSQLPKDFEIEDVRAWLLSLYIPRAHRAHRLVSAADLKVIHRNVFLHAAKEMHMLYGTTKTAVLSGRKLPIRPKSPNSQLKYSDEEALWAAAKERDDLSVAYFAMQKGLLDGRGWVVLEGFADDKDLHKCLGHDHISKARNECEVYRPLVEALWEAFPGEDALKDEENRSLWNPILNVGKEEDVSDREKGVARYTTTRAGLVDGLESDVDTVWMVQSRALMDCRLGQIIAAMRLDFDGSERRGTRSMSVPVTGGRFLLTSRDCPRQRMHTDFEVNQYRSPTRNPGYFVVVTSANPSPIWVVDGSHFSIRHPGEEMKKLSKWTLAEKIMIPPYSVFVGRGDLHHGGGSEKDASSDKAGESLSSTDKQGWIRYHLYFVPHHAYLSDGIHYVFEFSPEHLDPDTRSYNSVSDMTDDIERAISPDVFEERRLPTPEEETSQRQDESSENESSEEESSGAGSASDSD